MKKILIIGLEISERNIPTHDTILVFKLSLQSPTNTRLNLKQLSWADLAHFRFKGRTFTLLKLTTYMNLSGKAVNYWMTKEKDYQEKT